MSLPKIKQPIFDMTIPSIGKEVNFRPFVVKEEKILLIAQQGQTKDIIKAIKQILKNCIQEPVEFEKLTIFDLEYMFLKIRAKSVNNIVKVSYQDNEDDEIYDFNIDLDKIEIKFDENNNSKIKVNDVVGLTMKYPSASITERLTDFDNEVDLLSFFVINCIDTIYDDENVYPASDYSEEELTEFIDALNVETFEQIKAFFDTIPKLYHKLEYTNKNGTQRVIEYTSLKDFFMWG